MEGMLIGEVIKMRRKDLGLTQEKLCEGICSPTTLSRIENGTQALTYNRTRALIQRLDIPDDRYLILLDHGEQELDRRKAEAHLSEITFWDATAEEKPPLREEALRALAELEEIAQSDDILTKQYILSHRALLGREDRPYTLEEQIDLILMAIRLTIPRFNLEGISHFLYSKDELEMVNQLACAYSMSGDQEKVLIIYEQLLEYIQEHNQNVTRYAGDLGMVTANYSRELMIAKRYREAVKIAELGRQACVKYGKYHSLAPILAVLANCYAHLGQREKSTKLYYQAYYIHEAIGRTNSIKHLKNDARDTLGLELP